MKSKYNRGNSPVNMEAGFDQLKARIERRQHNRKLRVIWWFLLLAGMAIVAANYMRHWF